VTIEFKDGQAFVFLESDIDVATFEAKAGHNRVEYLAFKTKNNPVAESLYYQKGVIIGMDDVEVVDGVIDALKEIREKLVGGQN